MSNQNEKPRPVERRPAPSINCVTLLGNLGADPVVHATAGGKKLARFPLATNETWRDKEGQLQAQTEWHQVVIYNQAGAELAETKLKKGSRVYVEGQLRTHNWVNEAGEEHRSTDVAVTPNRGQIIIWGANKESSTNADAAAVPPDK